jgi:hypothetical protein
MKKKTRIPIFIYKMISVAIIYGWKIKLINKNILIFLKYKNNPKFNLNGLERYIYKNYKIKLH